MAEQIEVGTPIHLPLDTLEFIHRAGLLTRPQRYSLGRGRGMVAVYPAGTTDQLLVLCIIHRSEKRLPYVAWRLWWEGYSVPTPSIRQFLEGARAQWQQGIEELRQLQEHPEQLSKLLERTEVMRLSRKVLAQARKRVGRKRFPTLMGVLVRVASGTFEGYAVDPAFGIGPLTRSDPTMLYYRIASCENSMP